MAMYYIIIFRLYIARVRASVRKVIGFSVATATRSGKPRAAGEILLFGTVGKLRAAGEILPFGTVGKPRAAGIAKRDAVRAFKNCKKGRKFIKYRTIFTEIQMFIHKKFIFYIEGDKNRV